MTTATHGALTESSLSMHVPTHDRKGREGKGIGIRGASPHPSLQSVETPRTPHQDQRASAMDDRCAVIA